MTDEEINKRIYELLGLCWHDWERYIEDHDSGYFCHNCRTCRSCSKKPIQLDFTTSWEGFGILITWWQKQEQLAEFANTHESWYQGQNIPINLISPRGLAEATVRFLRRNRNDKSRS